MPDFTPQLWKRLLAAMVVVDLLVVAGLLNYFTDRQERINASVTLLARQVITATPTVTPTLWAGPPPRPTATATLPPTPLSTQVLAEGGFAVGFTPTPRPTRAAVLISLPKLYFTGKNKVDVPVVNQIYYPEPFFPPGSNNACGPVALYAALQGLGVDAPYSRLRDHAVYYGFNAEGISKAGMVGTITAFNAELGSRVIIEHGNQYGVRSLIKQLGKGGVVVVLVRVKKENGRFVVTGDYAGSIGHFLLVERINLKAKKVYVAGSTLGMEQVPLIDFVRSWSGNPNASPGAGWNTYLDQEKSNNWAIVLKRS